MNADQKIEYEVTAECFRHNQALIHQGIAAFIALAAPLAAVAFASNFEKPLRILASVAGLIISVLWVIIASRLATYNHHHFHRLADLEGNYNGFARKDIALKQSLPWLKYLPGTTYTIIFTYLFCGAVFAGISIDIACS